MCIICTSRSVRVILACDFDYHPCHCPFMHGDKTRQCNFYHNPAAPRWSLRARPEHERRGLRKRTNGVNTNWLCCIRNDLISPKMSGQIFSPIRQTHYFRSDPISVDPFVRKQGLPREVHEPGCYLSAQFLRGFVVSANLRKTCWPFHHGKWKSPQNFRKRCAEVISTSWLAKLPRSTRRRR